MKDTKLTDFSYDKYSKSGEDGIIEKIFEIIGTTTKLCVELNARDGFRLSNTANLWTRGWGGILIEPDTKKYKELEKNAEDYDCLCLNKLVSADGKNNLENILKEANVNEKIDLLSIDIGGDDYHIFKSLNTIKPKVIICEYNPTIPPNFELVQVRGGTFGSSSASIISLAGEKGYTLVSITDTNCIFVVSEEATKFLDYNINYPEIATTEHLSYVIGDYSGNFVLSGIPVYGIRFPSTQKFAAGKGIGFGDMVHFFRNKILDGVDHFLKKLLAEKQIQSPPPDVKAKILSDYGKKYNLHTLVETGTYLGDTVDALKNDFKKIISIELSEKLYNRAKEKFSKDRHISILKGDSGIVLKSVLDSLKEPALFWLDGHVCGGITAKGEKDTPIIKELQHLLNHPVKNHVILIDDARRFIGDRDYPTIKELLSIISKLNNNLNVNIEDDIIRIFPSISGIIVPSKSILHSYTETWRSKTGRAYRKAKNLARNMKNWQKTKDYIKYISRKYLGYDPGLRKVKIEQDFLDQKNILSKRNVGVIFDIGANVGQTTSKYRKLFPHAKIYGFEPYTEVFEKYIRQFRGDKKIYGTNCALADESGKRKFFVNNNHYTNSLLPINRMEKTGLMSDFKTLKETEVATQTVDLFCSNNDVRHIDILKLDVQGGELLVLEGSRGMLAKGAIDLIYTEVMFVDFYQNQPLFADIKKFVEQYNYKLYKKYNLDHGFKNNPVTGDVIFIRSGIKDK